MISSSSIRPVMLCAAWAAALCMADAAMGQAGSADTTGALPSVDVSVEAGGEVTEPTPFSVWLPFAALRDGRLRPALPIWLSALEEEPVAASPAGPPATRFRMKLREMPELHRVLLVRVLFNDLPDFSPEIVAWSQGGLKTFHARTLGDGSGMATQETRYVPVDGVADIDVIVPGDGSTIRGVYLASLKESSAWEVADHEAQMSVRDPYENLPELEAAPDDRRRWDRVQATLDAGTVQLSQASAPVRGWEFELVQQPLVAVVTFEVLGAVTGALPELVVNGENLGTVSVHWPDLADPAYLGETRELQRGMRFYYSGWLRAQVLVPGALLRSGLNAVCVQLSTENKELSIRRLEMQLKYASSGTDYQIAP